ncbi:unnamed protein product [Kluyveromyces dobzhanskii CBS 2104]|uniref:Alkaline phosphatase n=1 Tax=Kluyveromyces dobzhanskii CBS 2104 TaxID=1427455 RepID=A0A0A8L2X3_9SACH|nr:unnamed protein product [Kluyveromyces dobzhanskii CBS 2104]
MITKGSNLSKPGQNGGKRYTRYVLVGLVVVLVILTTFSHNFTLKDQRSKLFPGLPGFLGGHKHSKKKNVIFFVSDGMGPASMSMARSFQQHTGGFSYDHMLNLDDFLVGSSRTRSSNSLVTDSAAGATAFSCGLKSYNGAIGMHPDGHPCGTVLEAAKLQGYLTGLVVTTRITDATPASFSAHADLRGMEQLIAQQQLGEYELGRMVDLMIGGGRTNFYPNGVQSSPYGIRGSRTDGRDLIKEAIADGWQYVGDRDSFDALSEGKNVELPLLALLADYDIPFDIDRSDSEYPSLKEEAMTAINALSNASKDSDHGFFLLVEGSRIDHAGHLNDPAAQVREVIAYDETFKAVVEFAKQSDVETVIISTSDHETGGLVTARQVSRNYPEYLWYPEVLEKAQQSCEYLARKLIQERRTVSEQSDVALSKFIKDEIFRSGLGIEDYTADDVEEIKSLIDTPGFLMDKLTDMVSVRAQIGWTTHGHSAVDVNIYAYSNRDNSKTHLLEKLGGNHENTEIGQFMGRYLDLDLEKVTHMIENTTHVQETVSSASSKNPFEYIPEFQRELKA